MLNTSIAPSTIIGQDSLLFKWETDLWTATILVLGLNEEENASEECITENEG